MNKGYIYIRIHTSYDKYNVCKLGKTINLIERNSTYKTGEVESGYFEYAIELEIKKLDIIEKLLQNHFKLLEYHYYLDGGIEFFKKDIISLIIPYLKTLNLQFTVLSKEQIKLIIRNNTIKKIFKKININNFINILTNLNKNNTIIPREHQINVLLKINDFYKDNNIGKLIHACGLGKALLGILIVQKLKCKTVIIGVPSIYLQKQMRKEIMKIYNNHNNILYIGGEDGVKENDINKFFNKKSDECKFFITTYDSCHKLLNYEFDFKIGDEAHHLVGSDFEKTKDSFHKIKSNKTLFMTATEKVIENNKTNKVIYSMDDKSIFGELIDQKTINWAIENKKITDYNLVILKNTENEINDIINNLNLNDNSIMEHKDLFLSAFMSLKSIEKYDELTHILIYTNKTDHSELVKKYIDIILDLNIININKENYYNKSLHSKSSENLYDTKLIDRSIKEGEISKFQKASWGIISGVYIFGEGFDCPKLNGVVFSENMESDIRIVQSTLRPNRLDINFPNKKAYVIIPYIDTENFLTDNESFDKCRKIIAKIRNVDEKIEQKINVVTLNKCNYNFKQNDNIPFCSIIEKTSELQKIILRLRYSKALDSKCSEEEDEFNYVRELNKQLNIQSKEDYTNEYIKNPEEYFKLKGVWTNWYDFLGVDTKKFIQDKNDWINFCKENNVKSLDDYKELCKIYEKIPMNPLDFYIGCLDIPIELEFKTKRRG
jgi:superfamily II DNA or RNA helicase